MARPGRGLIACTPEKQQLILWMVTRGHSVRVAARAAGMTDRSVYRHALRDRLFREQLDAALQTPAPGRNRVRRCA